MSFFTSFIPSKTTCVEGKIILHLLDITLNIFFVPSTPTSIIFSSLRFDDSLLFSEHPLYQLSGGQYQHP